MGPGKTLLTSAILLPLAGVGEGWQEQKMPAQGGLGLFWKEGKARQQEHRKEREIERGKWQTKRSRE